MGGYGVILLDTHVLIWAALTPEKLSNPALQTITLARSERRLAISDISLWETAMLVDKGRIRVEPICLSFLNILIESYRLHIYPISPEIAAKTNQLPSLINKNPADRIIAATALAEDISLVTADRNLRQTSEIRTIW